VWISSLRLERTETYLPKQSHRCFATFDHFFWVRDVADEKGFKVFTLKDCVAATSIAAQDATLEYNFGMFSVPTTSKDVLAALQAPVTV